LIDLHRFRTIFFSKSVGIWKNLQKLVTHFYWVY
jgi:hypothetical protein